MTCNILDPAYRSPAAMAMLAELSDLRIRIARMEVQLAGSPTPCCETDRPESCGCQTCPDARRYDRLEELDDEITGADVFRVGPAGTAAELAEAFCFPPPPIGVRRAARMLADQARATLSYADHARNCTSFDGGAA